ncbi:unnamed protein product [Lactuca virosa]|uniref:Uncharacterized protein n=1 Tax=Lactuca virosa TaxID=75947 RepID=A0AAU9M2I9_9ASTR|nr:unnamed protein product [Lactuca virosa]
MDHDHHNHDQSSPTTNSTHSGYHLAYCRTNFNISAFSEQLTDDVTRHSCPICSKSVMDMSMMWKRLDEEIEATMMPEDYRQKKDLDAFSAAIVTRLRAMVARDEFRRRRRSKAAAIVQVDLESAKGQWIVFFVSNSFVHFCYNFY